ncbi:MAG: hypothetical protein H7Z19_03845, partial [Chitinophagaceae bacterium]|nr:hypothetical protein [Rubrivivax sp.]
MPLTPERDQGFWIAWLSEQVAAHAKAQHAGSVTAGARRHALPIRQAKPVAAAGAKRPAGIPVDGINREADTAHNTPLDLLLADLGGDRPIDADHGLSAADAAARLARDGTNEILDITGRSASEILLGQIRSVPVALLGGSAALALATRAYVDAGAIGTVLVANATLGFVTERRAEKTVSSLREMAPHHATVMRDGAELTIDGREVVVGDVLVLQPGEPVAADARVVQAHRLATNEAALTGESLPVRKAPEAALPAGVPLGERRNMVFMGTVVSGGAG